MLISKVKKLRKHIRFIETTISELESEFTKNREIGVMCHNIMTQIEKIEIAGTYLNVNGFPETIESKYKDAETMLSSIAKRNVVIHKCILKYKHYLQTKQFKLYGR